MTGLPHEVGELLEERIRRFLGKIMATGQGATLDAVTGNRPPFAYGIEAALDHAVLAPPHRQRNLKMPAGIAVGAIVLQVDGAGGPIVLAQAMGCPRERQAALILGNSAWGERA
ncbi:hypothetical protein [Salinicola acroporae]|uniref:hypothetical protein n=1 Tax=Salinicola acroporae TaxID=1541440 RepID=UPI0031BB7A79